MKICYLVWTSGLSGGTKIIFETSKLLALNGYDVSLVILGAKRHTWFDFGEAEKKIEFLYIEPEISIPGLGKASLYKIFDSVRKLLACPYKLDRITYLAERIPRDCDIYIATYYPTALALQLSAVKGKKVFFVQDFPELIIENEGAMGFQVFTLSLKLPFDAFICNSHYTASVVRKVNERARIFIGGIGIDTNVFRPLLNLLKIKHREPYKIMAFIGKHRLKGGEIAIEALNILAEKLPIHALLIVSDRNILWRLRRKINFRFTAFSDVPTQRLVELYNNSNLFIFTSHVESFGLPPLESMACGTPVVTTDCKGIREYAINYYNAIIVPPGDPKAVAEAAYQVLTDPLLERKLIENGLKTAKEWSWDTKFPHFEKIIKSI